MARLGRPRKAMARRKPCGRLYQAQKQAEDNVWPTPEVMNRRKALLGSASEVGELECPITLLGRHLEKEQAWAARKAKVTYGRYMIAVQPPRIVCGALQDYVQGSGIGPMISTELADEYRDGFEEMRRAVLREVRFRFRDSPERMGPAARQAWREVHSLMQGKMPRNIHALRYGLDAIVRHYDLAKATQQDDIVEDRRAAA